MQHMHNLQLSRRTTLLYLRPTLIRKRDTELTNITTP